MIDDLGSDGVLHVLLDETLEIARAVGSAVALFGKIGDDALVPGEGGAALGHCGAEILKHKRGDRADVFLRQMVEVNDLVHAVDELGTQELLQRLQREDIKEVIIATNSTVEGEATALWISKYVKQAGIKVTRIASGVPVGGALEFIDEMTLFRALEGRTEL